MKVNQYMQTKYFISSPYLLFFLILITSHVNAQISKFDDGFKVGFKEGYCYNSKILCNPPITPLTPLTRIGESLNSYQDGYNRGFQVGLDLFRLSSINEFGQLPNSFKYLEKQTFKSSEYVLPLNLNLLATVLARKQAIFNSRKLWIQDQFDIINDLSYSLLKEKGAKYHESMIRAIDQYADVLNKGNYDITNDKLFGEIQNAFKLYEKWVYDFFKVVQKEQQQK
jgi:hypothetical protein